MLGLLLVVFGWFAGSSGVVVRRAVTGGLERTGAQVASTSDGRLAGVGRWVAANVVWLRTVAVLLGAVVLLWGNDPTLPRLWWALALSVVLLAGVQILVGAGQPPLAKERTAPARFSGDGGS